MRIVMIGPFAWSPKGTVNARAFLIARALVERGHQVTILMPPYDNPSHSGYEWARDGVALVNSTLPGWGDSLAARLIVPLSMARRAVSLRPDLVHVFKPVGYAGMTGIYLRTLWPRLPLVLDSDDWEGRGGWADAKSYPRLWRWVFEGQERWLIRRADVVTVASRVLERRMWRFGLRRERVTYLPNGPNPLLRQREQISKQERRQLRAALGVGDAPLALYIGHVSYDSELGLIVDALPHVVNAVPDIRVVIMGSGAGLPMLRNRASAAGMADRLVFTGWVEPVETPKYLEAADIALYPYHDTLVNRAKSPSKITAYMAMGLPIVASAVGEIGEYLDSGVAGLLVEPGDARAFAEGMVRLLRDPEWAAELGCRAEKRIWDEYDWSRMVVRVEDVYQTAVAIGDRTRQ